MLAVLSWGCQQTKNPKPAKLRALSMIPDTQAELTIRGQKKNKEIHKTLSLSFTDTTSYQQLPPGYYKITLTVGGKELLKGTYVMGGGGGQYTLLSTGLLPDTWSVNPQSLKYQLKHMFTGTELADANAYLPQWIMMRDNYEGSTEHAYLRIINSNPFSPSLTIKGKQKTLKAGLAYPEKTELIKIKPGSHHLRMYYGKIQLAKKSVQAKPGYVYTVIIGDKKKEEGEFSVLLLENPSKALRKSR